MNNERNARLEWEKRIDEKLELSTNHLRIIEWEIFIYFFFTFPISLSHSHSLARSVAWDSLVYFCFHSFAVICLCYSYWLTLDWIHVLFYWRVDFSNPKSYSQMKWKHTWAIGNIQSGVSLTFFLFDLTLKLWIPSSVCVCVSVFGFRIDIDVSGPSAVLLKANRRIERRMMPKKWNGVENNKCRRVCLSVNERDMICK